MEPIKIEVSVELNLSDDSKKFISALFAGQSQAKPAAPAAPTAQQPKPQVQAPKPAAPAAPAEQKSDITIEDVRKVLASKVNEHRAEIKEKLDELGAPSVTKLDPEKYQELYDFLTAL